MIEKFIEDAILTKVFTYLNSSELLLVESINHRWNQCAKHSILWLFHSNKIWQNVKNNKPSEVLLFERIKSLPLSTLKNNITKHVNCIDCIEKNEYQKMMMARLFLRGTQYPSGFPYKMSIPKWCINMNIYKSSCYFSYREIHRTKILKSELCSIKWKFHFKHSEQEGSWDCKFLEDFSLDSALHSGTSMSWQFTEYNTFEGGVQIQVEQYPKLTCSRLPTGDWRMENNYVFFKQQESLTGDNIPLL